MGNRVIRIVNTKLIILASTAVLILGSVGFFEDAEAGLFADGVLWTGEGDGSSWNDPDNWRDFETGVHRLPVCTDFIAIDGEVVVHLNIDFTLCPEGFLEVFDGARLIIDPGNTLTNEEGGDTIVINCNSTLEVLGFLINAGFINLVCDSSALINNGNVINQQPQGLIFIAGTFTNNGPMTNNDEIFIIRCLFGPVCVTSGVLNNNDVINNNGLLGIDNTETLNNNAGATINNEGTIEYLGNLNNNADGVINNKAGADIQNVSLEPNPRFNNFGTINNDGDISNEGGAIFDNAEGGVINNNADGFINNSGNFVRSLFTNNQDATIQNDGEIENDGIFENFGIVNNNDGGLFTNFRQFTNEGTINNKEGAIIDNDVATIDNIDPDGLIINEGLIKNPGDFTINNFATIINLCTGEITGEEPDDQDDGITFNRSCNGSLYSISKRDDILREIDPTTGETVSETTITLDEETILGGTGLATNPLTGELFALLKLVPGDDGRSGTPKARTLVTIVPETGIAAILGTPGNTGDSFAGIAFDSAGNLFGVTGDGANVAETLFTLSKTDGSATELCELVSEDEDDGETIAHNSANGLLYHNSRDELFETIDGTSGESCDVTDVGLSGDVSELTALTFGADEGLFFAADVSDDLYTISPNPGEVIFIGKMDHTSKGLAFVSEEIIPITPTSSAGKGSSSYQDPNLGDVRHGNGHDNGFCHFTNCMNVDGFFNHFPETIIPQGSTQSFTILVNCPRGASTCNHISLGGGLPDSDFYDDQWTVTIDRQVRSDNWDLTVYNPFGEIDGDAVSVTVQSVGQSFVTATFNIPFLIPGSVGTHDGIGDPHENNRHLHVTVWDSNGGVSNYIFNEGIYVDDIFAYPQVETSYDEPIEYEPLCLNENPNKRYTCAFDLVKEWTTKQAEEKLKLIYNEQN